MWIGVPSAASPRRPVRYYTAPVNQLPRIVITSAPATSSSIPGPKSYDRSLLNFPLLSFPFSFFCWLFELGRSLCFLSLSCFSPILSLGHSLKLRSHALVCFCCCHSPPQCHGWRHYLTAICGDFMAQSIPLPLVQKSRLSVFK